MSPAYVSRFSKAPETFRSRKAIASLSVSKYGKVYAHETSGMKGTPVHNKNTWIKQLCSHKVQDFAMVRALGPVSRRSRNILAPGPLDPESSALTMRLPSHFVNTLKHLVQRRGCCFNSSNKGLYARYLINQIFQESRLFHVKHREIQDIKIPGDLTYFT